MTKRTPLAASFLATFLTIGLAACAQPELPPEHYYRLEATSPADNSPTPILQGVLVVELLQGNALTSQRPMNYSSQDNPLEVQQYNYHYWIDTPPRIFQEQILAYFRAANLGDQVVIPEMRLLPDYILSGRINRLERVMDGDNATAVIEVEFDIISERSDGFVLSKNYSARESGGTDMAATIAAFNRGFDKILRELTADLKSGLAS